jgi:H+-translocating NAD(P) transhydrogenase
MILPGRHAINTSLLVANAATMGAFVTMAPGAPTLALTCLGANTALSFIKGYTTTAAIGGADMRKCLVTIGVITLTKLSMKLLSLLC